MPSAMCVSAMNYALLSPQREALTEMPFPENIVLRVLRVLHVLRSPFPSRLRTPAAAQPIALPHALALAPT